MYVFCRHLYAFLHCILPQVPFFLFYFPPKKKPLYFAQIFKLVSIVSYPKCRFSPFYFAQNAFFVYVFCQNLQVFSIALCPKCIFFPSYLAQNAFFWLYFAETSRMFSIIFCPKRIFSPLYFAQNAVFPVHSAESTASSPASAHRSPQSDSVYPRKPKQTPAK